MNEWFESLSSFDTVLSAFAIIGGMLFLVQVGLMLLGFGDTHDVDAHGALDTAHGDVSGHVDGHPSADLSFKLLSFQGLASFFMMFGLVGLALSRGSGAPAWASGLGGTVAGGATVMLIDRLFRGFSRLQHSGTLDLKNAIGQVGTVYLGISGSEPGKIQVPVQGKLSTLDAVSEDKQPIAADARVKVVGLVGTNTLVVAKI